MRHRIHVPLRDDPSVLCDADALAAGDGRFRLVGAARKGERLLFERGEIVECEIRTLPNRSKGLVATRSISADPEYRKKRNVFAIFGAVVGAMLGATIALWIEVSPAAAAIGAALGGMIFAFCSARWGDSAWEILSRILRWS